MATGRIGNLETGTIIELPDGGVGGVAEYRDHGKRQVICIGVSKMLPLAEEVQVIFTPEGLAYRVINSDLVRTQLLTAERLYKLFMDGDGKYKDEDQFKQIIASMRRELKLPMDGWEEWAK